MAALILKILDSLPAAFTPQ